MTTFLTDRDLGKLFAAILMEAGVTVERHDQHFAPEAPDEQWLRAVSRRDWIVLTHDRRIRYKPNERDAVMRAGIGMFVLIGTVPTRELARNFVSSRRLIEGFVERQARPFIAKIYRPSPDEVTRNAGAPGRVELWLDSAQWRKRRATR